MIKVLKRSFDLICATIVLVLSLPLLLIVSIFICLNMGFPIFFRQTRAGYKGRPFRIYKFRTMSDKKNEHGILLDDDKRLTSLGHIIRTTSLDELPQLLNVIKGEMSLVGPRPLLMEYEPLYTPRQKLRSSVLPGITGWAQINGRNNIAWSSKLEYDAWYAENQSFYLDIKILVLTLLKVFKREGVSLHGEATTVKFNGRN